MLKSFQLKAWLKHNIFYLILLIFVVASSYERVLNNFKLSNTKLNSYIMTSVNDPALSFSWPIKGQNSVLFFWMTTCAPCKLDMARLKKSVNENKIPAQNIYAINPFEDSTTIKKYLSKNPYPFNFVSSNDLSQDLNIKATPTIVLMRDNLIMSISTGISLIGIFRAEHLFQ